MATFRGTCNLMSLAFSFSLLFLCLCLVTFAFMRQISILLLTYLLTEKKYCYSPEDNTSVSTTWLLQSSFHDCHGQYVIDCVCLSHLEIKPTSDLYVIESGLHGSFLFIAVVLIVRSTFSEKSATYESVNTALRRNCKISRTSSNRITALTRRHLRRSPIRPHIHTHTNTHTLISGPSMPGRVVAAAAASGRPLSDATNIESQRATNSRRRNGNRNGLER